MTPPPPKTATEVTALLAELQEALASHGPMLRVVNEIFFADTHAEAAAILKDNRHVFAQLTPELRQQWLREIDQLIDAKPVLDEYEE
jgi:hypothetical protein